MDFKSNLKFLQELWVKLVLNVVTNEFKHADMLAGIRILDKSFQGRENIFRIEIWTKFSDAQKQLLDEMQQQGLQPNVVTYTAVISASISM